MPLHPLAEEFLTLPQIVALKPIETLSVEAARRQSIEVCKSLQAPEAEAVAGIDEIGIPGPQGALMARIYRPTGSGPFPVCVYFHGGGWVQGNLDSQDAACRGIANGADCVVVSVDYRHAPEHKFPTPAEDCYLATSWVAKHGEQLNIDPRRLAVVGMSAGANLAAAVTLMARDRGGPHIAYQALLVPVTNHAFDTPSYRRCGEGYGLTLKGMQWYWSHYLATPADGAHPHASPLRADDLRGLPDAFVMTSKYDPLLDEGEAYAKRLSEAGVDVSYECLAGMLHGFHGPQAVPALAARLRAALVI